MARILCIDYGLKRCGLAVTDPFQIIVTALTTVPTDQLVGYLQNYFQTERVGKIVLGYSAHKDGNETYVMKYIREFEKTCRSAWPGIEIDYQDESFSSVFAKSVLLQSGVSKKKRQDKGLVDKISAVIILQKYLKHI